MKTIASLFSAGFLVLILACPATAQDISTIMPTQWQHDPLTVGDWYLDQNWTLGVPTGFLPAEIANGGTAMLAAPDKTAVAGSLQLGNLRSGTLIQRAGTLGVSGDISVGGPVISPLLDSSGVQIAYALPRMKGELDLFDGTVKAQSLRIMSGYGIYPLPMTDCLAAPGSLVRQFGGQMNLAAGLSIETGTMPTIYPSPLGAILPPVYPYGAAYDLRGGTLTTPQVSLLSQGGTAGIIQSGGQLLAGGGIDIRGAGGTAIYRLERGSAWASAVTIGGNPLSMDPLGPMMPIRLTGNLALGGRGAALNVTGNVVFGTGSQYAARWGSQIHLAGGDLVNTSTSPFDLSGLGQTRVVFTAPPYPTFAPVVERMEVAGKDLGMTRQGFVGNFVTDWLQVGADGVAGDVRLQDAYDNQVDSSRPEALYVRKLVVGPGSVLDLNGLNLYCLTAAIDPSAQILNGKIIGGGLVTPTAVLPPAWAQNGDFDLNGRVDGLDFLAWQAGFRTATDCSLGEGDSNGDGVVNGLDFLTWQRNFNPTGAITPVPEPTALGLLLLAGLLGVRRRQ